MVHWAWIAGAHVSAAKVLTTRDIMAYSDDRCRNEDNENVDPVESMKIQR